MSNTNEVSTILSQLRSAKAYGYSCVLIPRPTYDDTIPALKSQGYSMKKFNKFACSQYGTCGRVPQTFELCSKPAPKTGEQTYLELNSKSVQLSSSQQK